MSFLLLESGDFLLLESGDKLLLEEGIAPAPVTPFAGAAYIAAAMRARNQRAARVEAVVIEWLTIADG